MRALTDDDHWDLAELDADGRRRWIEQRAAAEQQEVDAALRAGAGFFINWRADGGGTVHTTTCHHARWFLDRQGAWAGAIEGRGASAIPHAVEVLAREEVETRTGVRRCEVCAPDVTARRARPIWASDDGAILAQSLKEKHFGFRLTSPDGEDLGVLESVEALVRVRTSTGEHLVPARARVGIVRPADQ